MSIPRSIRSRILAAILLCATVVAAGVLYTRHLDAMPKTVHVVRTVRGFIPSRVVIKKGDSVVFSSQTGQPFWPGSDYDPTQVPYPDFDSKQPVAATSSWSFTFDQVGSWSYHDHLDPAVQGTIIVTGDLEESVEQCLKEHAGDTIEPECWSADITQTLESHGLDAAFDLVRQLYAQSPDFQRNCHDVMHILGADAYTSFENGATITDRPEVSYCGWGFYHGFIEAMLSQKGPNQYGDAIAYCARIRGDRGEWISGTGACYHGVGHAVFDSLDTSLYGSELRMSQAGIKVCESVFSDAQEQELCSSGVFNALANAMSARTYGLTFSDKDPIPVCRFMRKDYQPFCYIELGNGYIRDKHWDSAQSIRFIDSIPDEGERRSVIEGYMDAEIRIEIDTASVSDFASLCADFTGVADQESCVLGTMEGLRDAGDPGNEAPLQRRFCAALSGAELQAYCTTLVSSFTAPLPTTASSTASTRSSTWIMWEYRISLPPYRAPLPIKVKSPTFLSGPWTTSH
jgi:plastocyanin